MIVAVDLGGTQVRIAACYPGQDWEHSYSARRPDGFCVEGFIALLQKLSEDWNLSPAGPMAIGVSVAAVVDNDGVLQGSENLGWKGVPLACLLREAFGCPVNVDTDVHCGALFEAREGAALGASSALYIGVGTGVGHALVLDGRVWRGAHGGANAFGHLVLDPAGETCCCGNRGCLCQSASGLAQDNRPPSLVPLQALARGIGAAVTLFEPEVVVFSGGALNQPWFDLERLVPLVYPFAYPVARLPRIVRSTIANPNLRGALLLCTEIR